MEKNRKPRIAVIGLKGLPAFGGAATVGENIIDQLKNKYDFTVYSISSHTKLTSNYYKNICYQIVFKSIRLKKINVILYYFRSAFHALFSNYDVIHLHHRDATFVLPILRLKYKVLLTTHGMVATDKWRKYEFLIKIQDKIFFRFANQITTVSKKDNRIIKKFLPKKNILHIPNGINIIDNIKKKYLYSIVFASGRIISDKGCHILLNALIDIEFKKNVIVLGDINQNEKYTNKLFELAKKIDEIEFIGLIKDKTVFFDYLLNSRLFIYPSVIESMSMMMLEAASLKTPILCSDIPENRDIFNSNEVLYFEVNNYKDLSNKIVWAFENYDKMLLRSENAWNKLKNMFSWQRISVLYDKTYQDLLSNK